MQRLQSPNLKKRMQENGRMSTPYRDLLAALPAQPKTRLVTGVAGCIGSNLLETLLERDQTVAGLDHRPRQPPGRDLGNPAAVNQVHTVAVGERTTLNALVEAIRETRAPRYPHLREVQKKHLSSTPHSSAASPMWKTKSVLFS